MAQVQEADGKVSTAEESVKTLTEAVEPFTKEPDEPMGEDEAFALIEKLSAMAKEAQATVDGARTAVATVTKDTRGLEAHKEGVKNMTERLAEATSGLLKAKKAFGEHESKFLAKKIIAECGQKISEVEEELKKIKEKASPLLEHGGDDFLVQSSTQVLASVLREHAKAKDLTEDAIFSQISGQGDGKVSQSAFITYLEELPKAIGRDEVQFEGERRLDIFNSIDADKDGFVSLSEFKAIFQQRFICVKGISVTDSLAVSKSKTTGKVEVGEILQALGDAQKDEATGMLRLECKSTASDVTGFITMMGNQGSVYLEPYTEYMHFCQEMDKAMDDGAKSVRQALVFLRTKESELARAGGSKAAAIAEARAELTKCKSAVSSNLAAIDNTKKKLATAKGDFAKKDQAEKNAHIEVRERKEAALTSAPAEKVEAVEARAKKVAEDVKPLVSLESAELEAFATPVSLLEEVETQLKEMLEAAAEAKASIKEQMAGMAKVAKGPLLEARKELHKMEAKCATLSAQAKANVEAVGTKCKAIVDSKYGQVAGALRAEIQKRDTTVEKLFEELKGAEDRIQDDALCSHLASLEGFDMSGEHARLVCRHIEKGGIGKRKFCAFLQKFFKVVKPIAITNDFDVAKAKTVRKAEQDEIIEVLEGPQSDPKIGLKRIRGKSLADLTEGWISVVGNQGTPFLEEMQKPFYCCIKEVQLMPDFKIDGQEPVRALKPEEVLELIEGPKKEAFDPALRARGKACSDGAVGWFTIRDKTGAVHSEKDDKFYTCTSSVAMTDNLDIKDCKVIRKLAVGESFTVLEGPIQEGEASITRVRAKALKDEKEGWVTTKGNAGTVYASASSKHYLMLRETPMQKKLSSLSEKVRDLAKDEMVESMEEPKEESCPPEIRIRCKATSDGAVGWVTLRGDSVKKWSSAYKCLKAAPLHDTIATEGATVVRQLEAGEKTELLEGPTEDGGVVRMKARAVKDGAVGWATIRDGDGKRLLEPMV